MGDRASVRPANAQMSPADTYTLGTRVQDVGFRASGVRFRVVYVRGHTRGYMTMF